MATWLTYFMVFCITKCREKVEESVVNDYWNALSSSSSSSRCWDTNEHTALWWVIKGPVVASIMVWQMLICWFNFSFLLFFSFFTRWCVLFPSDQFCPLHWNNHHPGPEAAVAWYWREWIEHLPVSHSQQIHSCHKKCCVCVKNVNVN